MLIAHGCVMGLFAGAIAIITFPDDVRKCAQLALAIGLLVAVSTWTIDWVKP